MERLYSEILETAAEAARKAGTRAKPIQGGDDMGNDESEEVRTVDEVVREAASGVKNPERDDLSGEVDRILRERLPDAVKEEVARQVPQGGGHEEIVKQLQDVNDALLDIASAERKHVRQAKLSAVGSLLLFLAFAAVFVLITPGLFSLLRNLNTTIGSLQTTIANANDLLTNATTTVKDVNGILDQAGGIVSDVNDGINTTFDSVNTLLATVDGEVKEVGTAVDSLNEAAGQVQKIVDDNAEGVNQTIQAINGLDYAALNDAIQKADSITTDVAGVSGRLGSTIDNVNSTVGTINGAASNVNTAIDQVKSTISNLDTAIDSADTTIRNANSLVDSADDVVKNAGNVVDSANDTVRDTDKMISNVNALAENLGAAVADTTKVISKTMNTINGIDVESLNKTIAAFQSSSKKITAAADSMNDTVESLQDAVTGTNDTVEGLQKSVDNTNKSVEKTLKNSEKVDYSSLNDAIDALKNSASDLAKTLKSVKSK